LPPASAATAGQRVVAGEAEHEVGDPRACLVVGAGSSLDRRRRGRQQSSVRHEHAVGHQTGDIGAHALQHDHVREDDAVGGAVLIQLDDGVAVGGRSPQEVADVGRTDDEAEKLKADVDGVAAGEAIEVGNDIDGSADYKPVAAGAADVGVRAMPEAQGIVSIAAKQEVIAVINGDST
jgi:hypothetical protein